MTRSLPRLALPHLTDEAVAAFADGVLRGSAQQRARQHLAECLDCADAVQGQRAASAVLRSAAAPTLPVALLDRLRQLPGYAELEPSTLTPAGLSADGQPVFAAFQPHGPDSLVRMTSAPSPLVLASPLAPLAAAPPSTPVTESRRRRGGPVAGLATVAAAVTVGLLAATSASAGGAAAPARTVPVELGVTPAVGPAGSSWLVSPALDLTGRR